MEEFSAIVAPELGFAYVGDDVEFSCKDVYVDNDDGDYSFSSEPDLLGTTVGWDASPIILQDGRFEITDDSHVLRILNLQPSDNNTAVVCHLDGTYRGKRYRTDARAMIRLYSNVPHVTEMQNGESTEPTVTDAESDMANVSVLNGSATSFENLAFSPLSVFVIGSALLTLLLVVLIFAYRRRVSSAKKSPLKRNLRGAHSTVSRENSYQSTRFSAAPPRSIENVFADIEGSKPSTSFGALPVISVTSDGDKGDGDDREVYAVPGECESNTVPSRKRRSKRYLSPTNNKRKQESFSHHVYASTRENQNGGYECMEGNSRLRNCVSQPNLEACQEHKYVNWKQSQSDCRFSAPIYSTQINQNANAVDDEAGEMSDTSSVEYAELDLGASSGVIHGLRERESSGSVTQYAKILRILSVFRTRKSTRVKVTNMEQV